MHNIFEWRNYKNKQTNKKTTTTCWRTEELICIPIKQHSMTGNTLFRLLPMKNRKKKIITTNRYCVKQALARDFGSYFTFLDNYEIKKQFLLASDPIYKHVSRTWTSTMLVAWNKMDWGEQRDFPGLYNTRFSERRWFFCGVLRFSSR